MVENGHRWSSPAYADPVATAGFNQPLPTPPTGAASLANHGQATLVEVHRFVTDRATSAGPHPTAPPS